MITWIKNLLCGSTINKLREENEQLRLRLQERQEHINKTNSYWKGVIRNLKKRA